MPSKFRLKKGDTVQVISGKEKGKSGKILEVNLKTERVIVEGLNKVSKHVRANQSNPQGGVLQKEAPLHISNVMILDPRTNKPSRIGRQKVKAPKGQGEVWARVAKKSGTVLDQAVSK